jgi:hypothetical protein
MSTTAEDMRELLPAEPSPPPQVTPNLPAPPGVVVNNPPTQQASLTTPTVVPTSPTPLATVSDAETTRGQLNELLAAGSPYIEQARGGAIRYAASRGLQNSSIAAQAGEQAAISAALPIASETAAAHERRTLSNLGHVQRLTEQAQAGTINERLSGIEHAQRLIEQTQAGDINSRLQLERFGFDSKLSAQENVQRLQQLAAQGDLDARARLEQFNYATQLASQGHQFEVALSGIQHTQRLLEQAQAGDINSRLQLERFGFDQQLSAQDNLQRLQQMAAQGDINSRLQLEQFNHASLLADKEAGLALTLEDRRIQGQIELLGREYQNALGLNAQDQANWIDRQNLTHSQTLTQINAQIAAAAEADRSIDVQRASQSLQSQYLASISNRQNMATQEITSIYQTQGLTPQQQQAAVADAMRRLDSDIAALQAYYAQSPLWDSNWGGPAPPTPQPIPTSPPGTGQPPITPAPNYYNYPEYYPGYFPPYTY